MSLKITVFNILFLIYLLILNSIYNILFYFTTVILLDINNILKLILLKCFIYIYTYNFQMFKLKIKKNIHIVKRFKSNQSYCYLINILLC